MTETTTRRPTRRYRGGIFFPLLLIALGIIFLLNNAGALSGNAWTLLVNLWPVLLIAAGLDAAFRREGLAGAAFLVGIGTVFLLSNLGYLTLNVWEAIFRLWPLLLVAIGYDLVVGRRSLLASLVGLVLILGLLGGALWFMGARFGAGQPLAGEDIHQSLEGTQRAAVVVQQGAGSLKVNSLSEPGALLAGRVSSASGLRTTTSFSKSGDTAHLELHQSGSGGFFVPVNQSWEWNLGLSPEVPLDLRVELGAGEMDLDLSGLKLSGLDISMGVGQSTVRLPAAGQYSVKIEGAIGQIVIILPANGEARIQADTALSSFQAPPGYQKNGDTYTSPGYTGATNRIDLDLSQAIGQIVVRK